MAAKIQDNNFFKFSFQYHSEACKKKKFHCDIDSGEKDELKEHFLDHIKEHFKEKLHHDKFHHDPHHHDKFHHDPHHEVDDEEDDLLPPRPLPPPPPPRLPKPPKPHKAHKKLHKPVFERKQPCQAESDFYDRGFHDRSRSPIVWIDEQGGHFGRFFFFQTLSFVSMCVNAFLISVQRKCVIHTENNLISAFFDVSNVKIIYDNIWMIVCLVFFFLYSIKC